MPNGAKNWALTINNPVAICAEGANGEKYCCTFNEETDLFLICATERGQKGTLHLQAYVQLKTRTTLAKLKKRWPTAHLEVCKGTPQQNVTYCSKEGNFHTHGIPIEELKGSGARTDLDDLRESIDRGESLESIRATHYGHYLRYYSAIQRDIEHARVDRSWKTSLHIYWGDTGTGKSQACREAHPEAYWKPRGPWWDGYAGQEVVIIDDFYGWIPFDEALRIADRYPLRVPFKGGYAKFVAKKVIFTSNKPWQEWWPSLTSDFLLDSFERRIDECRHFKRLVNSSP